MRRSGFQKPSPAAHASTLNAKCQKCLQTGHWTADCPNGHVYKSRPTRTALLLNPNLKLPEADIVKDDFEPEIDFVKAEQKFNEDDAERLLAEVKTRFVEPEKNIQRSPSSTSSGSRERRRNSRSSPRPSSRQDRRRGHRRQSRSRSRSRSPSPSLSVSDSDFSSSDSDYESHERSRRTRTSSY